MKQTDWMEDEVGARERLCRQVEETFGHEVTTPSRFEALADSIFKRTGVVLSPTTLKRLWGYLDEPVTPRRSTLDALARYTGWAGFEAFRRGERPEIESGNVGAASIRAGRDVAPGERVRLFWAPDRVCVIEYDGGLRWHVTGSEGTRLAPGDTFSCGLIVEGEPLYLDDLRHGSQKPGVYVCGRRSGVRFIRDDERDG